MNFKRHVTLYLLALLSLSACGQSALPSPTLSKLGPNMQEVMEDKLAATGSWNMPPSANSTDPSELRSSPTLSQSNQ